MNIKTQLKSWTNKSLDWIKKQPIILENKDKKQYKINQQNLKWFIYSGLILYPLILAVLVTFLEIEPGSNVSQLIWELINKNIPHVASNFLKYGFSLFKIIYSICFIIVAVVSVIWLQILAEFDSKFEYKYIFKLGMSIGLGIYFIFLFGKNYIINFLLNNILSYLHITNKAKTLIIIIVLMILFNLFSIIFSWFVNDKFDILENWKNNWKLYISTYGIIIISSAIGSYYLTFSWIAVIIFMILFGIAIVRNFDRVLLNNGFIVAMGYGFLQTNFNYDSNIMIIVELFYCTILALYICEWIVAKVRRVNSLNDEKNDATKDVIKEIFGGGLIGSIIVLILVFLKSFI